MKRKTPIVILLLAGFMSLPVVAQDARQDCPVKADTISVLVDHSGSMMESPGQDELTQEEKRQREDALRQVGEPVPESTEAEKEREKAKRITTAKRIVSQLADLLPVESVRNGLYSIAPYTELAPGAVRSREAYLEKAAAIKENLEVLGRRTPIALGLEEHAARLAREQADGSVPVYLITDGREPYGREIGPAVEAFYRARPKSCIHVISMADTQEGRTLVEGIRQVSSCTRIIEAGTWLDQPEKAKEYIRQTLPRVCPEVTLSITGINFAFDRADISRDSEKKLEKALAYIRTQAPETKIEINGWTDAKGSDAYNRRLSQRRANAVREWLIRKGVDKNRLTAVGRGKSFRFDNRTETGRYQNRRMDFRFHSN